jgi:hypothetical protein
LFSDQSFKGVMVTVLALDYPALAFIRRHQAFIYIRSDNPRPAIL